MASKKWTKTDTKTLRQQLATFQLQNRMYAPAEAIRARVQEHRRAIILAGLEGWVRLLRTRAAEEKRTAEHFEAHPSVMGKSTPEMVERFTKLAGEATRAAEKTERLLARVRTEELPPEVVAFDPTEPGAMA